MQDLPREHHADGRHDDSRAEQQREQRPDGHAEPLALPVADHLRQHDLPPLARTRAQHDHQIERLAGHRHGRQTVLPDIMPHDHHIDDRIQDLQRVRRHERQREQYQMPQQRPGREIMDQLLFVVFHRHGVYPFNLNGK